MAMTLVLFKDGRKIDVFQFEDEDRVRVGRVEGCDVRIDSLGISRVHCEILRKDGFHLISDLGSSNGTYVNGKRVNEAQLDSKDVITLGEYSINYEGRFPKKQALVLPTQSNLANLTIKINPGALTPSGRVVSKLRGHLTLDSNGKNLLLQKNNFLIGRATNNDLQVPSRFAPRIAAIIIRERFCFRILDVSPKGNAITVNGTRPRNVELDNDSMVDVCGLRFSFHRGLPRVGEVAAARMQAQTRRLPRST